MLAAGLEASAKVLPSLEGRTGVPGASDWCALPTVQGTRGPGISREQTQGVFRDDVKDNVLLANQSFYVMKVFII